MHPDKNCNFLAPCLLFLTFATLPRFCEQALSQGGVGIPHFHLFFGFVTFDPSAIAEVFSTIFQRKQCDQVLNLPPTYFLNPKLTHFDLKPSDIIYYLVLPVWFSGCNCHIRLMDHTLDNIRFLLLDLSVDLDNHQYALYGPLLTHQWY